MDAPYLGGIEQQIRQREIESKNKWLTSTGFKLNLTSNAGMNEKFTDTHYVTADPSEPPANFKFRNDNKETFLYGHFNRY